MNHNKRLSVYRKTEFGLDFIGKYESIKEVSALLGIHKSQISRCLNEVKHYKTAHGYVFCPCDDIPLSTS